MKFRPRIKIAPLAACGFALLAIWLRPAAAQLPPGGALIVNQTQIQGGSASQCLFINSATTPNTVGAQACGGAGSVTSVSVVTANGVSGSVATATTTPAITLTLGAITPTTVNGNTLTTGTGTLTLGSVTLNAGAGGTLGSNAFTSTAFAPLASPTFTGTVTIPNGGVFGTPASLTLTNATGLPVGAITGLGTGCATFLATPSSANLASCLTDETGTGVTVFATSPTLATPTFTTSFTSPLHIGGAAASSTLTLQSTSGAGTTDAILFQTASQLNRMQITTGGLVNVGPNVTPTALFTVNSNTVAPIALGSATLLQMSGADGGLGQVLVDTYGTGVKGILAFRSGRGLGSAVTASRSGDDFGLVGFVGATAANTFANTQGAAGGAFIAANATEDWSSTNQGARLKFFTTPNTTAAISLAMILQNSGGLTVGGTTDPGAGKVNASNGFTVGATAGITRTCTIAVGNVLTFTLGILTATSGVAGCV